MRAMYDPLKALDAALRAMNPTYGAGLAERLLDDEHVYTSDELPRGFTIKVSIRPIPEPQVLAGVTLVEGTKYDIVTRGHRRTGTLRTLRGWTYVGARYGDIAQFQLRKGDTWGVVRLFWGDMVSSVTVSE